MTELTNEDRQAIADYYRAKGLPEGVAVTFSDVALPDRYSTVRTRSEIADFGARLAGGLSLGIPLASANMESVTGAEMAIALAREGGIGFLPQMIPLEDRVAMIERIRRTDSAFIDDPLSVESGRTLGEAKALMKQVGVSGVVVVDGRMRPVGIMTARDWKYEKDDSKKVADLMTKKLVTAPVGIGADEAAKILRSRKIEKLPLVDRNGKLAGLATAHGLLYSVHHPRALRDLQGRFIAAGSIGVGQRFEKRHLAEVSRQAEAGIRVLLIDTARAFSVNAAEALHAVKKHFPKLPVVIGNVCTPEGAKFLFENGADAVKVNQGRGHVCRTSEMGVGVPQLSAVAGCSVIARKYGGCVVADGGMKSVGDMVKAVAAGADVLMSGYLLVGTRESAAAMYLNKNGLPVKNYEGSASFQAQTKRLVRGNLDRLRRPEGVTEEVPVTGTVADRVRDILDGFRSAMSYSGVRTLEELREQTRFMLQTRAGLFEGTKQE